MSRSLRNPGNGCRTLASVPLLPSRRLSFPLLNAARSSNLASSRPALSIPVVETTSTFLGIVKEVGEMLRDVPYVKALSGVLLQIITIKEELTDNKRRCQELIDKVSPGREGLHDLEDDLVAYADLLQDVYAALIQCTSRKRSDRVHRWFNRGQLLDDMLRLERLLDDFRVNFSDKTLVRLEIHMNTLQGKTPSSGRSLRPILPPKPHFMYGREREKEAIISTLIGPSPARVAILGAGGIGKTTLAVSVLYDERCLMRYDSRYFVACDGVTSAELLLTELANVLRLPRDQLDENMHDLVLASFRRDASVICFDNLETAWDNLDGRRAVEELLLEFFSISHLAVLVTMRGTQRPAPSAGWSKPFLQPLRSLQFTDAAAIFRQISGGKMDEFAEEMIKEVDCIPLAVTLIGHMVQEENETTASLVKRWTKERTALIENGGDDRLSKLDKSIQCSLTSPRIKQDASATNILALLSLLPDGFPNREGMLDRLQRFLPPHVNLQRAVSTLRRVALIHCETLVDTPRLRLLSPVRHFSKANLQVPPELRAALVDLYIEILEDGWDYSDAKSHTFIPPELLNIRAVLAEAYGSGDRREALVKASITYTGWLVFMGSGSEEIIQLAIQSVPDSDELLASCFYWLGKLCMRRNDTEAAHRAFERAIRLHVQVQDESGEANDLYELGSLYLC
ncbi:Tetratricopeptide repeat protein 28 [Mycena venus]|uniref:Tetratricopeptide repeat protein 28 n=1 Tax=Mycena venus TaxID=2733690 RepID=A0A8H6TX50_9AGAR|nr:Tetratricopeptide repeat protein 28 [Mycena venus]